MVISIIPTILGNGLRLFGMHKEHIPLTLVSTSSYKWHRRYALSNAINKYAIKVEKVKKLCYTVGIKKRYIRLNHSILYYQSGDY